MNHRPSTKTSLASWLFGVAGLACALPSQAMLITTTTQNLTLANALKGSSSTGIQVMNAAMTGHTVITDTSSQVSFGMFSNASGTYQIGSGLVLSTGNVRNYGDGVSTSGLRTTDYSRQATSAQAALLNQVSGDATNYFDVTQFDVGFYTSTGSILFDVVFGSEEFLTTTENPDNGNLLDAFGIFLDGVYIGLWDGEAINAGHSQMTARAGTELDGVLPGSGGPMKFSAYGLDSGLHKLTFIIADRGDGTADSTAYIANLTAGSETQNVPEPASVALVGLGLVGCAATRRRHDPQNRH